MALAGDAARRRRQALPALRRALPLRRRLPGPPRPLPLRQLRRARGPQPQVAAQRHRARRACAARASRCARRPATRRRRAAPARASTTSTTRSAPRRSRSRWARPLDRHRRRACRPSPPPSGAPRRVRIGGRELSILLVKNPAGANEVLRTLALEDGEHDVLAVLNDNIADGRDVSWVWDADFEVLAAARAARDVQRHARGRDGAAAEVRRRARPTGSPSSPTLAAGLDAARCDDGATGRLFALPDLHGDARAARPARRARRRAGLASREPTRHLARRRVRRLRPRPAAVARAGRRARAAGARRRRRAPAASRSTSRAAGTRSSRSTATPRCSPRCAASAPRGLTVTTVAADARDFDLGDRRFALVIVPMQTLQLLGGADGRARVPAPRARAHLAPGRRCWRPRWPTRSTPSTRSTTSLPAARHARASTGWSTPAGRWPCATSATARRSTACARSWRATAPARPCDDVVELDRVERRRARGRGGGRRPARRAPRARIPADRRVRRLDGGDAPWLSGRCASARSIPTS